MDGIYKYKSYLFTVAYNLTSEVVVAEDLVQFTFEKWLSADRIEVENPKAYLTKILINEGFKVLERQKKERELYKGVWLPEPVITELSDENRLDPLDYAFLFLLERLNPYERAIVVLKEAFDYSYKEIAEILDLKEENCRQILHRSKEKLKSEPRKKNLLIKEESDLLVAFLKAVQTNDLQKLEEVLLKEVEFYSDGGGKVPAALKPLFGFNKVVKFLLATTQLQSDKVFTAKMVKVNGVPGILLYANGEFNSMVTLKTENGKISSVYSIRTPDKIK